MNCIPSKPVMKRSTNCENNETIQKLLRFEIEKPAIVQELDEIDEADLQEIQKASQRMAAEQEKYFAEAREMCKKFEEEYAAAKQAGEGAKWLEDYESKRFAGYFAKKIAEKSKSPIYNL